MRTASSAKFPRQHTPDGARAQPADLDVATAAVDLVASLEAKPWGQISPSVYETGRLVTMTPWLAGHDQRVDFLIAAQRRDGAWGGPDGYALVPTLSATEALLTAARRGVDRATYPALIAAAEHALRWLRQRPRFDVPNTPAIEIIVPALVTLLNRGLENPAAGLEHWRVGLRPPIDTDPIDATAGRDLLAALQTLLRSGQPVPDNLLHSLEVAGEAARRSPAVHPAPIGTVGASPAATAAWIGERQPGGATMRYLERVAQQHGGPVASVVPITVFERSWVLNTMAAAGLDGRVSPRILAAIRASLGPHGTPGGSGLPPDADTTAVALSTLARHSMPADSRCLLGYETQTHFCTWHGERTPSTSTNAHVLEALGNGAAGAMDASIDKVSAWLCDQQNPDGSWHDKWHASPYYATACCALALDRCGRDRCTEAAHRAVEWILQTQHADGSWGRWAGTAEETSYALQVLLAVGPRLDTDHAGVAAARGYRLLRGSAPWHADPPLWHDKDLYLPGAVVQATVLAAMHLFESRPGAMNSVA